MIPDSILTASTNTTGTGSVTIFSVVTRFRNNFTSIPVEYSIASSTEWEVGIGMVSASLATLTRTTVLSSSNANALVSFSAGTKNVRAIANGRYTVGAPAGAIGGTVFTQTADATTTANTLTTLFGTGSGSLTLPANLLVAGRTIQITMGGYVSAATVAGTHTLTLLLGGVTVATGASLAALTSVLNGGWTAIAIITCRTTGVGGTVIGGGYFGFSVAAGTMAVADAANTTTVAANTTAVLAVDLQLNNGAAVGTYTTQYALVQILN